MEAHQDRAIALGFGVPRTDQFSDRSTSGRKTLWLHICLFTCPVIGVEAVLDLWNPMCPQPSDGRGIY